MVFFLPDAAVDAFVLHGSFEAITDQIKTILGYGLPIEIIVPHPMPTPFPISEGGREGLRRKCFRPSDAHAAHAILRERFACILPAETCGRNPMIEVGANAPDFTLRSHGGEEISLSQFKGEKWVVLHTFPLAFTGG